MANARFDIEKVREVNTFKLISKKNNANPKLVYKSLLPNGFNISTSLSSSNSWFSQLGSNVVGGLNFAANALQVLNRTGLVNVKVSGYLDIAQKMFYGGSEPLSFSVNTFLILVDNYQTDILDPIQSLMDYYLPHRGNDIVKSVTDYFSFEQGQATGPTVAKAWEWINRLGDKIGDFLGPTYVMNIPGQLDEGISTVAYFGKRFYFEDIFVEKVSLAIPPMLVEGGRPDFVGVQISLKTLRQASSNMFYFNEASNIFDSVTQINR